MMKIRLKMDSFFRVSVYCHIPIQFILCRILINNEYRWDIQYSSVGRGSAFLLLALPRVARIILKTNWFRGDQIKQWPRRTKNSRTPVWPVRFFHSFPGVLWQLTQLFHRETELEHFSHNTAQSLIYTAETFINEPFHYLFLSAFFRIVSSQFSLKMAIFCFFSQ